MRGDVMKHSVVFYEPDKFAGWPANCGIWSWRNEILVSYNVGEYYPGSTGHRIDQSKPIVAGFSRSIDGGDTWSVEDPLLEIFDEPVKPVPERGFDFSNPDFVLRVGRPSVPIVSNLYLVSEDRGHAWEGPYALPNFGHAHTPRTCYLIEGDRKMRIFLSHRMPNTRGAAYSDRAFCALTEDGGNTWSFVGDMTNDLPRSVMPDVVRLTDGTLVGALRRLFQYEKYDPDELADYTRMPWPVDNWIEVRRSADEGKTWAYPIRAAETARDYGRNGNPPALRRLEDDTLVLAYGYRGECPSIRYKVSTDGGFTFDGPRTLRDDAMMHDLGYPRLALRPDGKCVAVYYIATSDRPENHIEATVFGCVY